MSGSSSLNIPLLGQGSAPGNYLFESDQSQFALPPATTVGGIVVASAQGPIMARATSPASYIQKYGQPNPALSLAGYSALTFLYASQNIIVRRAINTDATTAASLYFFESSATIGSSTGLDLVYTPYQGLNYSGGVPNAALFETLPDFSLNIPSTTCILTYSINGATNTVASTTIGATQTAFIDNLNTALAGTNITAALGEAVTYSAGAATSATALYIIGPSGEEFTAISIQYGSTTVNPVSNSTMADMLAVIANNPGTWPNNKIGWNIDGVDLGTPQEVTITFNRKLVTNDTLQFNANIYTTGTTIGNGYNLSANVVYATSNDATLTALATAIETAATAIGVSVTAVAVLPDATGNNSREITLTFQSQNYSGDYYAIVNTLNKPNNGPLDYTTANFVGTASPALTATVSQTIAGVSSTNTFNFNVWSSSNPNVPLESFRGSLQATIGGNGQTQNIETIVNATSQYVQLVSTLPTSTIIFPNLYSNSNTLNNTGSVTINWLNGGDNGSLPTNAQIAAAWNDFADPDNISVDMLINGGYATPSIGQAMDQVCQTRQDMCFAYLDAPSIDQATADQLTSYRKNQLNLNSNRSGLFAPDVFIADPYTGQNLYVPMSGYAAALQANADTTVGPQQAAAGPTYGALNNILGLRYIYGKTDRGLLNSAQVNVAKKLRQGGFAIYGAVTLQTTSSLLSYIPVRRIFSYVEELVLNLLEGVDFNNITPTLELNVQQTVNGYLRTFVANGAIASGQCITDSTVNTQVYANNGQFNVRVVIVPFSPAQFVVLDGVITNNASVFTESVVTA